MSMEKQIKGWVRLKKSDSRQVDLPCIRNSKFIIVKVFDYEGNELNHNEDARSVRFQDEYWYY